MCYKVVLLDESNIALFAPRFTFTFVEGDTTEAVQGEQYSDHSSTEVLLFLHLCSSAFGGA